MLLLTTIGNLFNPANLLHLLFNSYTRTVTQFWGENMDLEWTEEVDKSFKALKEKLAQPLILSYRNATDERF